MTMFDALTRGMNCDDAMAAILKGMCEAVANEVSKETKTEPTKPKGEEKKSEPVKEAATEKKPRLITVAYTENEVGSDAHVIFPTDASTSDALADITYALAYAIGDTLAKAFDSDRTMVANEMLLAMEKALIKDTLRSVLKDTYDGV